MSKRVKIIIQPADGATASDEVYVYDYEVSFLAFNLQSSETMDVEMRYGPGEADFEKVDELSETKKATRLPGPGDFRLVKTAANTLSGGSASGKGI